ncbi:MAG: hypothetical protein U0Q15_05520 [Kineosporiaceae bacterium]
MSTLIATLRVIENALRLLRRDFLLKALQPGIDAARVASLLGSVGISACPQVEELYAWRNGTDTAVAGSLDDIHMFPGFYFLSLGDAVANYRAFMGDPRWTPGWLPIFANGGGDFYVTELSGGLPGVVRHFRIEEREHPVEFVTLERMLTTIAAGFSQEIFFVDGSGYLEMDDSTYAEVAAQLNPGVPWWAE